MTWIPMFHKAMVLPQIWAIPVPVYASSLTFLSFYFLSGSYPFSSDTQVVLQEMPSPEEEEEEMKAWSLSLSDPNHKHFNPFINSE